MAFGLFGKVPQKRDFLSVNIPRQVLSPFEQWLQSAVAASRTELGRGWEDSYLVSPIWRFWIGPELFGGVAVAGALMPSVDQIGRYFPLAILYTGTPGEEMPPPLFAPNDGFYRAIEQRLLAALSQNDDSYLSVILGGLPTPAEALAMAPPPVVAPPPAPPAAAASVSQQTVIGDLPGRPPTAEAVADVAPPPGSPAARLPDVPDAHEPSPYPPMAATRMPGPPSGMTNAPTVRDLPAESAAPPADAAVLPPVDAPGASIWDMPETADPAPKTAETLVADKSPAIAVLSAEPPPVVTAPVNTDWDVPDAAPPEPVVAEPPSAPPAPVVEAMPPPAPVAAPPVMVPSAPVPEPPPPARPVETIALKSGGRLAHMGGAQSLSEDIAALKLIDHEDAMKSRVYFWCPASGAGPARFHASTGLPDPYFFTHMIRWGGAS